jgi:AraC family transcriptional regulator of adaptative response / DNA-3-methyladenine glycosylase II
MGWMCAQFLEDRPAVRLTMSNSLAPAFLQVQALCRQLLDLNADPLAFEPLLRSAFPGSVGLRVPGTVNGFELGVRAILGQQITVQAARTLGNRLVQAFGQPLPDAQHSALPTLDLCFPDAQRMAQLSGPELGALGIVRQRQAAIIGLAQAVAQGQLVLESGAPLAPTLAALQAIAGIGPWTAQYIAMRALQWPDAFPAGDVALHKALGLLKHPQARALAHETSLAWQPWRSYATIRAWSQLAAKPAPSNTPTTKVSP